MFREDGKGTWFSTRGKGDADFVYGVNGNLYADMKLSFPDRPVPGSYYWTYDGEFLTFQVWGKDLNEGRFLYMH